MLIALLYTYILLLLYIRERKEMAMKRQSYNQTTLGQRVRTTGRYLQRAKRHGPRHLASALLTPQTWLSLTTYQTNNGLSLYSQSFDRLARQRKDNYRWQEGNYMVIEYRH